MMSYLWVAFTLAGAVGQTARNAVQRDLTAPLGALGATLVRFLFGFPFALVFLGLVKLGSGAPWPHLNPAFAGWIAAGAFTQIAGTALMLLTMERRSFVVAIAYLKTDPVFVALLGLLFLGDPVTPLMAAAIVLATIGVVLISVRPGSLEQGGWRPAALGLSAGALFAASAIGYRGAILALHDSDYLMSATFSLVAGLALQTISLTTWLLLCRRHKLAAIFRLWRPSLLTGLAGAAGSEFWFLAFALATAASVRTLALVEVLFAHGVTHYVFRQKTALREILGMGLLLAGAGLIAWAG